jgi:hypothetical protein
MIRRTACLRVNDPKRRPGDERLRSFFALFDAIDRFEATSLRRSDCNDRNGLDRKWRNISP